jgi:hypothetical protein
MDKPQPGQWVFVPEDYPGVDPAGVLLGRSHRVVEPDEFENDGEITVYVKGAGEVYYLQIAHVRVVPAPADEPKS